MSIEFHRDGPWAIPDGWVWAQLDQVCDGPQYGWTTRAARAGTVKLLRTTDISSGNCDWATVPFCAEAPANVEQYLLRDDDLLISRAGSVGKSFLIKTPERSVFASYLIRFKPKVDARYLHYFLQTIAYWNQIAEKSAGIAIPNVNGSKLRQVILPIAPLTEQRRIVARIDELFTEIADGATALTRARNDLDTLRRSLLKAAVTGQLTREWREHNKPNETGAELVNRFRSARPHVGSTLRGWSPSDSGRIPDIPGTWAWCAVEEAGEVQLGRQRAPQHHAGENMRPYLRVANVFEGALNLSDVKQMNFTPKEFETFALKAGDILLNEGQTPDLLGRPAIYNDEIEGCCFQKTLLRFRSQRGLLPQFALIVFRHYMRSGRFKREARITTNMAHLTQVRFVVMEFPVPPTAEQLEIVRRFHLLDGEASDPFELVGSLTITRLRQAVLKVAFEGGLVQQDPRDEPADILLTRLNESAAQAIPGYIRRVRRARGAAAGAEA